MGHPLRIELTREGLLISLANQLHYLRIFFYSYRIILFSSANMNFSLIIISGGGRHNLSQLVT